MSANKNDVGDWRLNPKAPIFETSESKTLTKIIANQNEDIFSLKLIHCEAQIEINKKDEEIQRLKEIIEVKFL